MSQKEKIYNMFTLGAAVCLLLFFSISSLSAQENRRYDLTQALKIGAEFQGPEKVDVMRGDLHTVDWASLRNKVIVLDFFDTYCATCIQAMPHLQKLQQEYSDKLQVIHVTWQDKATLQKFFDSNKFLKENKVNLPIIYGDTVLRKLFPFQAAPHVVMLYQGKVQAITFNRLVTAANILQLHKNANISLPIKNDFGTVDLMDKNDAGQRTTGVRISGYQDGVPSKPLKFDLDSASGLFKTTISNRSIFRSLLNIWGFIQKPPFLATPNRVVWNVPDSSIYDDLGHKGEAWSVKHAISYERLDVVKRPDSVQAKIVLHDIHSLLGIRSYWSTKKMKCLLLRKSAAHKIDSQHTKNEQEFEGTGVLTSYIGLSGVYLPIIDQVKSKQKMTIGTFSNLEELNQQLNFHGLELVEGVGDVGVFVIESE